MMAALREAFPGATPRVVVLVHGLMCTETCWTMEDGTDYGARLAKGHGYTPLYVRYNTGLAIADSGAAFDRMLDALVLAYPVPIEELLLLGFSMGGSAIRGAPATRRARRRARGCRSSGAPSTWAPRTWAHRTSASAASPPACSRR